MEYCLETQALCKTYGRFRAVDNLSMHVPRGAVYGFVGKNGAGKTTLLRLICGLQRPTAGGYCLYGVPHTDKALCTVRRRMGAVVETPSIYYDLSAAENLKQQYRVLGLPSFSGIPALLELVGLQDTGGKKARHFSLGMRQRLESISGRSAAPRETAARQAIAANSFTVMIPSPSMLGFVKPLL